MLVRRAFRTSRSSAIDGLVARRSARCNPWQRGSNENTNGLLRQYFPKRFADFRDYEQAQPDAIASELNGRPRKTLQFMTPSEKFNEAVALTR